MGVMNEAFSLSPVGVAIKEAGKETRVVDRREVACVRKLVTLFREVLAARCGTMLGVSFIGSVVGFDRAIHVIPLDVTTFSIVSTSFRTAGNRRGPFAGWLAGKGRVG